MSASKALEMLAIGDLYEEAVAHPEQIDHIKSRLNYLIEYYPGSLEENHLKFVAHIIMEEIEKIEAEANQ